MGTKRCEWLNLCFDTFASLDQLLTYGFSQVWWIAIAVCVPACFHEAQHTSFVRRMCYLNIVPQKLLLLIILLMKIFLKHIKCFLRSETLLYKVNVPSVNPKWETKSIWVAFECSVKKGLCQIITIYLNICHSRGHCCVFLLWPKLL